MAALFSRIIPILFVGVREAERDFSPSAPDRVLTWQFGVNDLELAKKRLAESGVHFREELMAPSPDWQYRVVHARTPNGYHLLLEEGSE